jgi:flagellar hook-associated protein 2
VGRYEVRVSELARAQVTTTNSVHADSDSTVVASGGSLVIGGVTVTVAAGTTLEGLASAINGTANIGVTASVVHNSGGYALALTGNQTGASHGFGITNNLTGGSGVSFSSTNAQNASDTLGSVNGVPFSSSSNVVEGALPGGSLTLYKRAPTDPIVVTITGDTNSIKNLIRKFQEAYNGLVDFVADQQKAAGEKNAASIGRDPLVRSVRGELARVLNTERPSGTFTAISQVGLGFSRTGRWEFAEWEFDEAIRTDAASVERLFKGSGATLGAFNALQEVLEKYTSAEGLLPTAQDRLDDQLEKIAKRIDEYEARLEIRRAALQKEFTAADLAISQLNASRSQLSSLSSSLSAF